MAYDTIRKYIRDRSECAPEYAALVDSSIWNDVRIDRDKLLEESDWTVMPDSTLSTSKQNELKTYRQELRDIPSGTVPTIDENQNIVSGLTFPTKPI